MGILSKKGIRFNLVRNVDKMKEVTAETDEMLRRINLETEREIPAELLSYGKHRSLEVAMALSTEPELVMLDEPMAGMSKEETHYVLWGGEAAGNEGLHPGRGWTLRAGSRNQ